MGSNTIALVVPGGGTSVAAPTSFLEAVVKKAGKDILQNLTAIYATSSAYMSMLFVLAGQTEQIKDVWERGVRKLKISPLNFLYGKPYANIREVAEYCLDLLDVDAFVRSNIELHTTTLSLLTGETVWHQASKENYVLLSLAATALPGFTPPIMIGHEPHVDGGTCNILPIQRAVDAGYKKIVVLLNKPLGEFITPQGYLQSAREWIDSQVLRNYPAAQQAFLTRSHIARQDAVRLIRNPPPGVEILVLTAPSIHGTFSRTLTQIHEECANGYAWGEENGDRLNDFFSK